MSAENPVSPKAIASTGGAGAGALVATFVTWLLGISVWDASSSSDRVADALAAVPSPVSALVALLISGVGAAVSGWTVRDPYRITNSELTALRQLQANGQIASARAPAPQPQPPIDGNG